MAGASIERKGLADFTYAVSCFAREGEELSWLRVWVAFGRSPLHPLHLHELHFLSANCAARAAYANSL